MTDTLPQRIEAAEGADRCKLARRLTDAIETINVDYTHIETEDGTYSVVCADDLRRFRDDLARAVALALNAHIERTNP